MPNENNDEYRPDFAEQLQAQAPEERGFFEKLGAATGLPALLGLTPSWAEIQAEEVQRQNIQKGMPLAELATQMNLPPQVQQLVAQDLAAGNIASARATLGFGQTFQEKQQTEQVLKSYDPMINDLTGAEKVRAKALRAKGDVGSLSGFIYEQMSNPRTDLGIAKIVAEEQALRGISFDKFEPEFARKRIEQIFLSQEKSGDYARKESQKLIDKWWNQYAKNTGILSRAANYLGIPGFEQEQKQKIAYDRNGNRIGPITPEQEIKMRDEFLKYGITIREE